MFEKIQLNIRRIPDDNLGFKYLDASLPAKEKERAASFQKINDAAGFRMGRHLVRQQIGKLINCRPQDVPIEINAHGQPLCPIASLPCFSIAHCKNLVVVGWFKYPIGIDIEPIESLEFINEIEKILLHPDECNLPLNKNFEEYKHKLLEIFVIKEAFLKLQGSGLLFEPSQIKLIKKNDCEYEALSLTTTANSLRLHTLAKKWLISTAIFKE
jgi:phosphopantetheinyl transferase